MELIEKTTWIETSAPVGVLDRANVEDPQIEIQKNGNILNILSLKKITEISLFDQSGRIMKLGEKVNDHKYRININIGFYNFMALIIKIAMEDRYVFKRVDI